jgi:tetratricopeptide (TPR) repeat protein
VNTRDTAYARALALFQAGRFADAESVLRGVVAATPDHVEALQALGAALSAQGRPAEGLEFFDRVRALRPSDPGVLHNRAQALFALHRLADSRADLERALRLKPDLHPAWNLLGGVLAALGDPNGAERSYRRALALRPDHAETHYNLGLCYQESGRIEDAIASYRTALQLRPAFAQAHNNIANALKTKGEREAALGHYREAVRLDPLLADAVSNLGTALRESGHADEAVPLLERALMLRPESTAVLSNLGVAYFERGRFGEAVAAYQRALTLDPAFHEARNNLGNALAALGEYDEASACYAAVLAREPGNADAHSNLGIVHQERGELAAAAESFGNALALRPDHSDALNNLGFLLLEQGKRQEAMGLYRRALESNPHSARAGYNLALAHLLERDFPAGWKLHEWRFETSPPVALRRAFTTPTFSADDWGRGHRIALWSEQGVGDQILYSTLAAELAERGEKFVLEIDRRLVPAFRRAHPDWEVVGKEESTAAFAKCDRQISVGSLPRLLRPSIESFSRQPRVLLAADPGRVQEYRARLVSPGARVIGISWKSFQPKMRGHVQRKKSAPLESFLDLSRRDDIRLLDLQYGDTAAEREVFATAGGRLERLSDLDLFNDLDGVLAAIGACDLVVTTSNVTAHLAGALGRETLLVYLAANPPFHYWVPADDGRSPWYPSVRIVSAPDLDTWPKAFARIHELIDH